VEGRWEVGVSVEEKVCACGRCTSAPPHLALFDFATLLTVFVVVLIANDAHLFIRASISVSCRTAGRHWATGLSPGFAGLPVNLDLSLYHLFAFFVLLVL